MSIEIKCGDCVEEMSRMEAGSIQLVVTSPPYGNLRTYNGHIEWDFESASKQVFRVLCEGGICCWNVGDEVINGSESLAPMRQAIYLKDVCGFRMHDTMIYQKVNFGNPERARYHQMFEYVFILSKGKPRCFNPIKDKKNKYPNGPWGKNTFRTPSGEMKERPFNPANEFGMRGNVWFGNTRGQEEICKGLPHPAMMPKWLARDLIISWSNEGDTVLDPFAGSGTTGHAATSLNRNVVMIDKNPEYIPLLKKVSLPEFLLI